MKREVWTGAERAVLAGVHREHAPEPGLRGGDRNRVAERVERAALLERRERAVGRELNVVSNPIPAVDVGGRIPAHGHEQRPHFRAIGWLAQGEWLWRIPRAL